jgi:hypothetical protein
MEIGFLCDEQLHSYQAKVEALEESKESSYNVLPATPCISKPLHLAKHDQSCFWRTAEGSFLTSKPPFQLAILPA